MNPFARVVLTGMLAIVAFDAVASVASQRFGFRYARAAFGSYMIYIAIGFCAARAASTTPVQAGALAAAAVGVCEASIGWAVSWQIGPGRLPSGHQLTVGRWLIAAVFVALIAAAMGAIGGGIHAHTSMAV